jgi:uncharacterized protein YprB with RNaseH-like and TPR domain
MLSEELRRKIEELNRQPLPHRADLQRTVVPAPHFAISDGPLAALIPGAEIETTSGKHYRVQMPLSTFWPQSDKAAEWMSQAPSDPASHRDALHPELSAFCRCFPQQAMFLDLETCGFAGSMMFLIGLVWHTGETWVLDQLLARNYAEERAILETLWSIAAHNQVLVTFNGKSFDWPMVLDRSTLHRFEDSTRSSAPGIHCDLLHHARRKWKRLLPNCKLQTLEQAVCRRVRHEDIGGADIPVAYHQFVRSGNARELKSILHHNAMDLVTLVEVTLKLARAESPRSSESAAER